MKLSDIETKMGNILKYKNHKILSLVIVVVCSLIAAAVVERGYSYMTAVWASEAGDIITIPGYSLMSFYRIGLFFFMVFPVLIHFIVNIRVFHNLVFKYRYVLAILIFFVCVINKINFSSIGMYDIYVQQGQGSEFMDSVFGFIRSVRSDEWLVTTPIQLSAQFGPDPYGQFNLIARGAMTENMPNGIAINLATLAFPMSIFYLFGAEYGVSARWVGTLIMTFMVTFEFAHIVSGKNRLLGVVGACLITFSPFFQWWSYVVFITSGMGVLVCFYYFINSETILRKALFAFGIAVFFSQFVVNLYPAWQIPAGYLYLGLAFWIVADNWDKVKKLRLTDYGILALAIVLIGAIVATYLFNSREYISAISNTVYPGTRHDAGGGDIVNGLNRMISGGVFAPISAFRSFISTNISEFGGIYTLFPIPLLFSLFMMIRKRIFDLLSLIIIAFTLVLGSYVFISWPEWFARITLMSFSISIRSLDVLLFAQVFLLLRVMSIFAKPADIKNDTVELKILVSALVVSFIFMYILERFSRMTFTTSLGFTYISLSMLGIAAVVYSIFDNQRNQKVFKAACLYMVVISIATLLSVHPVMKGLDAIYSKPLAAKITELAVDPDEKWVSEEGIYGSSFLIANGASTISSVNSYPNLELWHRLDPDRIYEEVYNRYAVLTASLTTGDTIFELLYVDHMHIHLSYRDLEKAGVKYVYTARTLYDTDGVGFTLLYDEDGARIYSVSYTG